MCANVSVGELNTKTGTPKREHRNGTGTPKRASSDFPADKEFLPPLRGDRVSAFRRNGLKRPLTNANLILLVEQHGAA
jgi:hypothetical protein